MKTTFPIGALLFLSILTGCATDRPSADAAARPQLPEQIATRSADEMAAAMEADPAMVSSRAASIARLMATRVRNAEQGAGDESQAEPETPASAR
jgi:hypothetical protein